MEKEIQKINPEYIKLLPDDLNINHILPFTYEPKPDKLLLDIRSFKYDFSFLDNIYSTEYNYLLLLYDLLIFCNNGIFPTYGLEKKFNLIVKRHIQYEKMKAHELKLFIYFNFNSNINNNYHRKIKFLWGLLTPSERNRFINDFIIDNLEFTDTTL